MKKIFLAVLLIASLALTGCGQKVAATVNGKKIYEDEVEKRFEILKGQYQTNGEMDGNAEKELKESVIDSLINEILITEEAARQNVEVSKEEVNSRIGEVKGNFPDEKSFFKALEENKMNLADFEKEIEKSLVMQKMMDKVMTGIKVTDEEVKKHYEENKESFVESEQIHSKHILLKDEETAKKVLTELKDGSDFAKLASKHSTDPGSKDKGGDLGWMGRDQLVPEFAEAAFNLQIGQLSDPVKSQFGYHIIVVEEKKEATQRSFEDVKGDIKQILLENKRSEKFQKWIEGLKKEADIKKNV